MRHTSSYLLPPFLGVIVSQFPELHETFIVRELRALKEGGIPLRVYSLKRCHDRIVHPEAQALIQQTTYLPWNDGAMWFSAMREFVRQPLCGLASLIWTLRYHPWPISTVGKALVVWIQAIALAGRMRTDEITHIHAHWATMPTNAAVIASRWLRVPFSFTAHAWDIFVRNPSLKEKIRLTPQVITCTEYNRRYLVRRCPAAKEKIVLNYHGVDLARFQKPVFGTGDRGQGTCPMSHVSRPIFLSVGRLVETKGFETLIGAYQLLRDRGVSFRAMIVGEGPLRRTLKRQIQVSGLSDLVELRPPMPQDELRQLYPRALAFVLPCVVARNGDRDGIPNVILEAMAMGIPVVSTTISGIPEAVQDKRTGLLVPPDDSQQLADAIRLLIERPSWAHLLGEHGRMWAEAQFDAREHMRRLVEQMKMLFLGQETGDKGQGTAATPRVSCLPSSVPVRVLYVIWSLGLGGAEQVAIRLASGLDRKRFEPLICCLNAPGPFAEQAHNAGINVIALRKRGPFDVRVVVRLVRLMRSRKIDVVHTHLWGANFWGRIAARLAGVPVVIATEHNVDTWKKPYHLVLDRWLARWTTALIAVSKQVQTFYESHRIGQGKWGVIYNGVDPTRAHPRGRGAAYKILGIREQDPVIGLIGRLVPAKAPEVFVEAVAYAVRQIPNLKALIIGDGPLRQNLQAQVHRLGLEGRVILTGMRQDIPALLAGMDLLVFSSEREGLSMAMLEAMASGVPVIATRVGGTPELIEDGVTGVLVPPGDPQAIAARLVGVLRDPAMASRIRETARAHIEQRFSLRRMIEAHESLYLRSRKVGLKQATESKVSCLLSPVSCPIKIAYIIDDLGTGGAQQQLYRLLAHLDRTQFDPVVVSLSAARTAFLEPIRDLGIEVIMIPQDGAVDLRAFWRLYRILRRGRFAIVQTCLFTADLYGRVAACLCRVAYFFSLTQHGRQAWLGGVPIRVTSVRSIDADKPRHYVWADRVLAPLTHRFIANADCVGSVLQQREHIQPGKIQRIYNGVILNGLVPHRADHATFVVGSIGRLEPEKDYDLFVRAFARAYQADPRLRLLLVGEGSQRARLEALAYQLQLSSVVEFAGFQDAVESWLARMDCFVLPSRYEGCSNALLEAMAAGRPVIATSVGGNPELIEDGVSGWLVPPGDEGALAQAILRVCRDQELASRVAVRARQVVCERFTVSRMVEDTMHVYHELLQPRQSSRRDDVET